VEKEVAMTDKEIKKLRSLCNAATPAAEAIVSELLAEVDASRPRGRLVTTGPGHAERIARSMMRMITNRFPAKGGGAA
jgi:hypothetical protein